MCQWHLSAGSTFRFFKIGFLSAFSRQIIFNIEEATNFFFSWIFFIISNEMFLFRNNDGIAWNGISYQEAALQSGTRVLSTNCFQVALSTNWRILIFPVQAFPVSITYWMLKGIEAFCSPATDMKEKRRMEDV